MAAVIWEIWDSGGGISGGQNPSGKLRYVVYGSYDDTEVETLLNITAPATYRGLSRQNTSWEPEGGGVWLCTADYGITTEEKSQQPTVDEHTTTFDTSAGTQKITQSILTVGRYSASLDNAPDYKGAIGVNGETVEGVEIYSPKFEYSETHYVPAENVTQAYIQVLYGLTARVNNATWRGFPAGELLFLGASGSHKWEEGWQLTFKFLASANAYDFDVGDIHHVNKLGHDYLWIKYADALDSETNITVKMPRYCYVERVYHFGDFQLLGLGA